MLSAIPSQSLSSLLSQFRAAGVVSPVHVPQLVVWLVVSRTHVAVPPVQIPWPSVPDGPV
jgi:hypothetical protein